MFYFFLFPSWRIEGDSSFGIFIAVSQDVNTLKASSVSDGQVSVSFGSFIPFPDFTKDKADSSSNCKGVGVKVGLVFNFPISFSPKGHSVGHAASGVSNSGPESIGTVKDPFGQSQRDFRKDGFLTMPVELEVIAGGVGFVLLDTVADVSEDFGFGGIVNFGVIFDFINGSETEVSRGNSFLGSSGKFDNGDVKCPGGFFEDFEGAFLLGLHGEFNF